MTSSELIRWSGLAAIAGGVSLVIAEFITLSFFGYDFSRTATTGTYALYSVLIMIAGVLLPLGLVGLYENQSEASGSLGFVGFVVAFVGTVLVAGFFWASAFVAPLLAVEAPELLAVRSFPGFFRSRSSCSASVGCYSGLARYEQVSTLGLPPCCSSSARCSPLSACPSPASC